MHEFGVVVDYSLLHDREATMQKLLAMDADNTLFSKLKIAFGHWYITNTPEELKPVERTEAMTRKISRSLKAFDRQGKVDPEVPLFEEIKQLGAYLTHRKDKDAYKAKRKDAEAKLDAMRKSYVVQKLYAFDMEARLVEEQQKWGWSPLYALMKNSPSRDSPSAPWQHTADELECFVAALTVEETEGAFSLERQCPHVARALKMFVHQSHGNR